MNRLLKFNYAPSALGMYLLQPTWGVAPGYCIARLRRLTLPKMALSDSQKGRIIEQLVAATQMLQSDGNLRVSVPLVDDEGVDLAVGNRLNDKTLILQIKSRFNLNQGRFHAHVRRNTCKANPNRFLLFVFFEKDDATLGETCWLVRADTFCELLENQNTKDRYVFISSFTSSRDMWKPYRLLLKDLARTIKQYLQVNISPSNVSHI